ncbi:MAG: glycosyltransferase family 2 protein [Planctomycetales bacterium]|nr:glycosyltransferase family 2 protein [Planctomycetales bacterium]
MTTAMKNDLVTVVIPAYNHQDYVGQTIRSILNQTHRNIELVIFNDGSVDNTDAKIRELIPDCENRFTRFAYIPKDNEGLAATLNRAIDWASGEYLFLIASDDVAKPHTVQTLYGFLCEHEHYALAVGDNDFIDETGQRCGWDKRRNNVPLEQAVYSTAVQYMKKNWRGRRRFGSWNYGRYKTLLKGNYITNGKMYQRQALIRVGRYIPGMKVEDWYMNLQLAKYYRMKYIDEVLLSYRWHGANSIRNPQYLGDAGKTILQNERKNHPEWFKKYADKKIRSETGD